MTCERYWREGIVRVEQGVDDPHRAGCVDCTNAHASRQELIEALPSIGLGHNGDPRWQAHVWQRIDGERARASWRWPLASALAVACVALLWIGRGGPRAADARPEFAFLEDGVARRSRSVVAGARLQVKLDATSELWLYRADQLILRCRARQGSEICAQDPGGMTVEVVLATAGRYHAFAIKAPGAPPRGALDEDRAALETAKISYEEHAFLVR